MRLIAAACAFVLLSSSAYAIDPFELQCSRAFDNKASGRAGASWAGANKARYCACVKKLFAGSADDLREYNDLPERGGDINGRDWDCFIASDRTTNSKFRP